LIAAGVVYDGSAGLPQPSEWNESFCFFFQKEVLFCKKEPKNSDP
jgi:hypothetical protein